MSIIRILFIISLGIISPAFARDVNIKFTEIREIDYDVKGTKWISDWDVTSYNKTFYTGNSTKIKKTTKTILAKMVFDKPIKDHVLLLSARVIDLAEVYIQKGDAIKLIGVGGNSSGKNNLNMFTSSPAIEIKDTDEISEIYFKVSAPIFPHIMADIKERSEFQFESEIGRFLVYGFFGCIFIMTISQIILYFCFKSITSVYYIGFSWCFGLVIFCSSGVTSYFFNEPLPILSSFYANWLFTGPLHLCLVFFTANLLGITDKYKWILTLNKIICASLVIIALGAMENHQLMGDFFSSKKVLQILMLTSVVLINILGFFESKRIATVLMLSWTPVIAYGLIAILGLAPINAVYAPALLIIPAIFEMLISSAAAYLNMQNIQRELLESEVRKKQNEILKQAMRTISHDLANHFFVAEHCIEAVKKQNTHLDPKSQSRLNKVKKSLTQSTMLLNRVKCWIQVGDGKVKVHNEAVAITPLIKESIELFEERAKEKNIQISTKWDQECEQLKIWGDPVAVFNQVINNTLSNAIKFSYHNSAISIEVHQINDNILVTIKDSGIGIKKIDQLKFIQNGHIESTFGTGNEKGTGFGMSLMKTYMEAFDGSVTINSSTEEANRGTEIVLSFKFAGKNETSFIDDAFARAGIA